MNLKELAKELNLSISSVSKALRDSHEISASTKKLVLAKAKELNYQVNPFASSLRKKSSKTIAVVIPEITYNFFVQAIDGIETFAQEKGYHVLIYLSHEDLQKEIAITRHLQNGRVDGILMALSRHTNDTTHLEELRRKNIPLIFFDRVAENINAPKIITDDYNNGMLATEHLIKKGCKRIAFLSISTNLSIINNRMAGYTEALKKHGISDNNNLVIQFTNDNKKNRLILEKLLKRKNRPDGIFASVEKLALSVYEICAELKLTIPRDIKIISFSNLKTAALLNPSLTTITLPAFEMGHEAASLLFKLIEKKGSNTIPDKTVLKSLLIERNSTKGKEKKKLK